MQKRVSKRLFNKLRHSPYVIERIKHYDTGWTFIDLYRDGRCFACSMSNKEKTIYLAHPALCPKNTLHNPQ